MSTNTTSKRPASATTAAPEEAATATATGPVVVGPPLQVGERPVPVTLSHHLAIDGTDYPPGSEISVCGDYARRLRAQGFVSRT